MTTAAPFERRADGFHQPRVFLPVVATTLAVAATALLVAESGSVSVVVVVLTIALLGIPHGAVDHLAAAALGGPFDTSSQGRFAHGYVLVMLGVGLVWLVAPTLALVAFLAVSVHHFGQSDLAYLGLPPRRAVAAQWSRGVLLIGLPLVAHLESVSPVIERLGGGDPASWAWLADWWILWSAVLVTQHVVIGWALAHGYVDRPTLAREAITVTALTTLFLAADPLIGFAVYFGLWHSLAHLFVLGQLLGTEPAPLRSVARLAAPLSAVSLLGISRGGDRRRHHESNRPDRPADLRVRQHADAAAPAGRGTDLVCPYRTYCAHEGARDFGGTAAGEGMTMTDISNPVIDIGIPEAARVQIASELGRLLADTYTLYLKTHNYHWNVTGPMFNTLHLMFEVQYNELWLAIDLLAERIRSLGEFAPGSYAQFAELSSIAEADGVPTANEMLADLVAGHEAVARTARAVFGVAERASDQPTADLITQRLQVHEKTAWMLRSMLA